MTDKGTLHKISPGELDEVLARVRDEGHSEFVLLGSAYKLSPSSDDWPADLMSRSIFQLTDEVDGSGLRWPKMDKLRLLILKKLGLNDTSAVAIAERATQLTSLDLYYNNIGEEGAEAIAKYVTHLNTLDLSFNEIGDAGAKAIAESPTRLKSLRLSYNRIGDPGAQAIAENQSQLDALDLDYNQCSDDGAKAIAENLTNLTMMNLTSNTVGDDGAKAIAENLPQLRILHLRNNNIGHAGARTLVENLTRLEQLNLDNNKIGDKGVKAIAENLAQLSQLYALQLGNNTISDAGAKAFEGNGTRISSLDLSGNTQITSVTAISTLSTLRRLNLAGTSVSDLSPLEPLITGGVPVTLNERWSGPGICVKDCPLVYPTVEVISQGQEAVLNYFREIGSQGVDHLYEAKVLILGEGRAGKTSLMRRLYQPEQPLPTEEETTKGIDIHHYEFTTPEDRIFKLNIWDFGSTLR